MTAVPVPARWPAPSSTRDDRTVIEAHDCILRVPLAVGDEVTCRCGARYVAIRRRFWSRRLEWRRNVFALPSQVDRARQDDENGS